MLGTDAPKFIFSVGQAFRPARPLHNLLAEGRISPRRASVFAYIDSLLLNTARELQGRNLNYYGLPIKTYDWSSFPDFNGSDSTSATNDHARLPEPPCPPKPGSQ